MGKYDLITDSDIRRGIEEGEFKLEDVSIVRHRTGHVVKHLKNNDATESPVPPTIFQVHKNIIYQADLEPILSAMLELKNSELFEDLNERYQIVLSHLKYYISHEKRLDELNSKSMEALTIFDTRLKRCLEGVNTGSSASVEISRISEMLECYSKLSFIYLLSTWWLHKEGIAKDLFLSEKIHNMESLVKEVYKHVLWDNNQPLSESVYAYLFIHGGENIHKIDKFIKNDDRVESALDFFESYRNDCMVKSARSNPSFQGVNNIWHAEYNFEIAEMLNNSLVQIKCVKNNFNELLEAGNIDGKDCEASSLHKGDYLQHLSVISPQLGNVK
ncbi:hypothetical protein [Halomonas sp.]|uniref:hypothetical protein n=1 Tax=Halomonas sp. TaxID=1486246 RepID=UPI00298E876C|nr:hypothetical protein [Halomonas sp.]MDW7748709.1 hypothetical protein [Halomonas sp.]